jgi:hypothetical protein
MNRNIRIFLFCPIPENQKPMTEFLVFKENPFFYWISFSTKKYQQKFLLFSFCLTFFSFFFFLPFFSFQAFFPFFFSFFLLFFSFFNLFFRCSQLQNRLENSRLFYEEGSWYDGQIWEKPLSLIKNERLISTQKVQPILQRILFPLVFFLFVLFFFFSN